MARHGQHCSGNLYSGNEVWQRRTIIDAHFSDNTTSSPKAHCCKIGSLEPDLVSFVKPWSLAGVLRGQSKSGVNETFVKRTIAATCG